MSDDDTVDHYGATYSNFASELYATVRREAFPEDIGQTGWLTSDEQDDFIARLTLEKGDRLLDIACGSGGPTLRIAEQSGCDVVGIDIHQQGIEAAGRLASGRGLEQRAVFQVVDGSRPLPFDDSQFDGLICIDAVNHLADRESVFAEWFRVLKPGGRLVFTDPIVVTGPLTNEEIRIRSSIGFFLFVPAGVDEQFLGAAGFEVREVLDRTENMAFMARNWLHARARHEDELVKVEGRDTFDGQQTFFEIAANVAEQRRLSRFAFHAIKPSGDS